MSTGQQPQDDVIAEAHGRGTWILPLVLFCLLAGLYTLTSAKATVATDAYATSVGAWRLGSTGTPWLDGLDVKAIEGTHRWSSPGQWLQEAPNGHVVAHRMVGPMLAAVPFYAALDRGTDSRDFRLWPGGLAAALLTAGAVTLMFLALRRLCCERLAMGGALCLALATPTWAVSANGLWTHTLTQLGLAGAAWGLAKRGWWTTGLFIAFAVLARPHIAVVALVVGVCCAWKERRLRPAIMIGLPGVFSLALLAAWNRWYFGEWSLAGSTYPYATIGHTVEGPAGSFVRNVLGFLVSPERGVLVWSPALVLLVPAVVRSWRVLPSWSKWLALGGTIYSIIQLRLNDFAGGTGFFAYRHGLELVTCLVPLLVASTPRAGHLARALLPVAIALQFSAMTLGAAAEGPFASIDKAWSDNDLFFALRVEPAVVGTWLLACLIAGISISVLANRRRAGAPVTGWPHGAHRDTRSM